MHKKHYFIQALFYFEVSTRKTMQQPTRLLNPLMAGLKNKERKKRHREQFA